MTDRYDPNDPFAEVPSYQDTSDIRPEEPMPRRPGGNGPAPPRSPLLTGLVLALLLVVLSIAMFQVFSDDTPADPIAGGDSTTTTIGGETTDATDGSTTIVDDQASTTLPTGTSSPYVAIGDPVQISDLPLQTAGIGEVTFGMPSDEAMGRLIASLGDPDEDTGPVTSDGTWGTCEGETERVVTWGPLAAINVVDPDGTETFASYRLDLALGGLSHPAIDLATLSGLQVGRSYRQLEQIYSDFEVRQRADATLGTVWELESTNTGNILLYGPLTTDETVRGIFALDACGRF